MFVRLRELWRLMRAQMLASELAGILEKFPAYGQQWTDVQILRAHLLFRLGKVSGARAIAFELLALFGPRPFHRRADVLMLLGWMVDPDVPVARAEGLEYFRAALNGAPERRAEVVATLPAWAAAEFAATEVSSNGYEA